MKKLKLFLFLGFFALTFISCTQGDLSEILNTQANDIGTEGEEGQVDPEDEPPGKKG
ncbi:hypothetical protein BH23BAC2_BH23BAC2_27850 [soil metagenome]